MKLIEVKNRKSKRLFNKLPRLIYKNDPNWACPLTSMVEDVFSEKENSFFNHGAAIRWVLVDDKGNPIGRIAAFVDYERAKTFSQPTGNIGFFECKKDKEVAAILFDAARSWLSERGMEAMDGPANLGENYINHGLLAMGFTPQGFGMPYNPPYYVELFENYGFNVFYQQFSYHLDYNRPFPERFWKIAEWVAQKPQFSFKHFEWSRIDEFVADFSKVYEGAWRKHEHFKPLDKDELKNFITTSKFILDPEFVWLAYHNEEPIALFVMVPDFNQALRAIKNGRMSILNMLKIMKFKKNQKYTRARILIMGVVERFQNSGIESAIFWQLDKKIMPNKPNYTEIELSWAGDFNPKIISVYKAVGGVHSKTHYQMRYLFDREKPFERSKIIGEDQKTA